MRCDRRCARLLCSRREQRLVRLEVDFCRAVAAAIFDDAEKVRYTPLTSQERFAALSAGEIDILSRTTTWTMSRDTDLGITFAGVMYYDGQGFMVREADGIASAMDLSGAAICIESGTTTELNAADYFETNSLEYSPVVFTDQDEVVKAFEDGRYDVYTTDASALAAERSKFANPDEYIILPEIISREPLGPIRASRRRSDRSTLPAGPITHCSELESSA